MARKRKGRVVLYLLYVGKDGKPARYSQRPAPFYPIYALPDDFASFGSTGVPRHLEASSSLPYIPGINPIVG